MRIRSFKAVAILAALCGLTAAIIIFIFGVFSSESPDVPNEPTVPQPEWEIADNTVVTPKDSGRIESYSFIHAASFIAAGDYCDVRILFPTGQNYIVLSKKKVLSADAENICFNVCEHEVMAMSSALYDVNRYDGTYVYLTKYTSAGDTASIPDYPVSHFVYELCLWNPNMDEAYLSDYMNYREQLESKISHLN